MAFRASYSSRLQISRCSGKVHSGATSLLEYVGENLAKYSLPPNRRFMGDFCDIRCGQNNAPFAGKGLQGKSWVLRRRAILQHASGGAAAEATVDDAEESLGPRVLETGSKLVHAKRCGSEIGPAWERYEVSRPYPRIR